ncbi:uncharacterized protein LOC130770823 [Actinidia eriantha]|uniref:uncharacterized protein LOC130770823 n=1 Tax=Actinidia eriantha TaxID=165200 RepID=UPI002589DB8B|nr:uncharacterized protein LOC130770823 [Actinidia eriantha]XP_057484405.1 uncharacterized protein LOC130770823 [Actinidia eriantha]XP_057484407.1 uncharacterized protein LOC130770823 [Actinidia eriantha]XP_057484408.1 uncharacterized protein LOC130770823 [Actinidia eriantha]
MSRCFPFPPPGYEKKGGLGDTDLLTKEIHKEKRHKKDKKDKGKREKKEKKKDKERSDGKHKEKKDQKDKHKDRKDKDWDKDKKMTLVEKNIVVPLNGQYGKNYGSNCLQNGDSTDSKLLLELGKRIKDYGARENKMFQSISVTYQKNGELPGRVVEINIGNSTEGKEKYKSKREGDRNGDGQQNKGEANGVANAFVQNFYAINQKRVGVAGPVDEDVKKHKHKDSDGRGDKQKDRSHEKNSKSKHKDRTKKEKEGKVKEKEPNKDHPILRESRKDRMDSHNCIPSYLLKESDKSSTYKLNLGKRKEPEMNGFLHDDGIRPNKLPRLISPSSHQLVENGRKLEPREAANNHKVEVKVSSSHQMLQNGRKLDPNPTAIQSGSESQRVVNSCKTDKDVRINGFVEAQQLNACSSKPPSIPIQAKVKVEASAKLPHPDLKYLSHILSVPQVAEWSDSGDQEWWFSRDKIHPEKPKSGSFEVDGMPQVWASSLRIESMDVTALPYVIPF